ncbi:MAG: SCP2 sterol-binding domain-containing protein [bacterium]
MEKCLFLSDEWVCRSMPAINSNEKYRRAARHLTDSVSFRVIGKHPAAGDDPETFFFLDLKNGECVEASKAKRDADYRLTAKFQVWKDVMLGRTDVIRAIVKGQISMRGNMLRLMRNAKAVYLLVGCFQSIPTRFE